MRKKVFVGLSGGVDSAVSAALLKRRGFDVTGVFILIKLPGYPCPAVEDRREAMRVAAHLRIPFREINLSKEYQERVFEHTLREFAAGRTPNPDVLCNREIKFGLFYDWAMRNGADYVATGHYAKNLSGKLFAGADTEKDQSYFLWMVPQEHLTHIMFPVGDKKKSEVRALAKKFGLPNARRKDSQGLCFLGDVSLPDMLERELHPTPGEVLSEEGEPIGTHRGVELYTLGQRHGFTVRHTSAEPMPAHFVIAKDTAKNTVTVSEHPFPKGKTRTHVRLSETNWIGEAPAGAYAGRYRYRQQLISAALISASNGSAEVELASPHFVPVGQSLVLYDRERCLGGGVVDSFELR